MDHAYFLKVLLDSNSTFVLQLFLLTNPSPTNPTKKGAFEKWPLKKQGEKAFKTLPV